MEKDAIVRLFGLVEVKTTTKFRTTCPNCDGQGPWCDSSTEAVEDLVDHIDNDHDGKEK